MSMKRLRSCPTRVIVRKFYENMRRLTDGHVIPIYKRNPTLKVSMMYSPVEAEEEKNLHCWKDKVEKNLTSLNTSNP